MINVKNMNQLSRREFLKIGGATSIGLGLTACGLNNSETSTPAKPTKQEAAFAPTATLTPSVNSDSFKNLIPIPQTQGYRYSVMMPDTLDLQDRANLAINALTRCLNPNSNYEPYFYGAFSRNPPVLNTPGFNGKFWEALTLMRHITGNSNNFQVDEFWRKSFLLTFPQDIPILDGPDGGRQLCWLAQNYKFEKNPLWLDITEKSIDKLSKYFTHNKDFCYSQSGSGEMLTGDDAAFRGWTLQGIASVIRNTGSSTAIQLGGELARYIKDHAKIFDENGYFLARIPSDNGLSLHFHHNGNCMAALSEYAFAAKDIEVAVFTRKVYEYARSVGWPLIGFFPEYIKDWPDDRPYIDSETCCIHDMVITAMNLSKLGIGDYWDDVDRYVRNQLAESQMLTGDWIKVIAEKYPIEPVREGEDGYQVSERVVGSFSGWSMPNDYLPNENQPLVSGCCTGNGSRAFFHVWENMLEQDLGLLTIHLLLNRSSQWADVFSYIPYQGKVDIRIKEANGLRIRLPEWVNSVDVVGVVNGKTSLFVVDGRYVIFSDLNTDDIVSMEFPISEREVGSVIGSAEYWLITKGNDVVSINPKGTINPLYNKDKYRSNQAQWVSKERFISSE